MFFRGYVPTKNKKCLEKFKDRTDLKTYDDVKELDEFAGVLDGETILVDIDDSEQSEILMNIVEAYNLNCRVYKTTRGKHFLFRNTEIKKCSTGTTLACGLKADIKVGLNAYSVLKFKGKERFIEWEVEGESAEALPKWLFPIRTSIKFIEMGAGDGRNQELFNYILTLQSSGFSVEECRECIRIINRFILKEPLSENELETILRDEAFKKPIFFKGATFLFDKFAQYLNSNLHIKRINGQLHIYHDGIYMADYRLIENEMVKLIPELKQANRKEVLAYLEVMHVEDLDTVEPHLIPFRNGLLNIHKMEMIPFAPEHIITNRIPWDYNPNAYDELLDQTLDKISVNDANIRALLEEAAGYSLFRRNELGKAFILTGTGSNGKSVYLGMLKHMLGKRNVSAIDLKNLADRFSKIMLFGKLANIGDDISDEFVADTSIFKKVITGESIGAEQKGQPMFEFEPYCKLFFSANNIPRMGKGRDWNAIKRRLVIIPFNAKFSKSDPDYRPYIIDDLKKQESMEYLLKIGIDGLLRVLERKEFTQSDKVDKEVAEYEESNNPILAFIHECEEIGYFIENAPTQEVYERYVGFCAGGGLKEISKIEFIKAINKTLDLVTVNRRCNGKQTKVFAKKG